MTAEPLPTLEAFLSAPLDQVRALMPATVIYTPGGTRRAAALQGIDPHSDEYVSWSRERMLACVDLFFRYGVRHLMMTALWPRQFAETGVYRQRLLGWLASGLAGPQALADYRARGWRVRFVGVDDLPELQEADARLRELDGGSEQPTIWWSFSTHFGAMWQHLLSAAARTGARTRDELVRAVYGEEIPPAGLWLSFGKPMASMDVAPALLLDETQCYWTQRPGYSLDDEALRRILFDYTYVRRTWQADKGDRYGEVLAQRGAWERAPILGLGRRLGSYWYPQLASEAEVEL